MKTGKDGVVADGKGVYSIAAGRRKETMQMRHSAASHSMPVHQRPGRRGRRACVAASHARTTTRGACSRAESLTVTGENISHRREVT